ncbi:MAG: hypothetical protein ING44_18080 [Telmatospirillum sp.]|nr:hypothetical protein [Telmatospirillum sp.]
MLKPPWASCAASIETVPPTGENLHHAQRFVDDISHAHGFEGEGPCRALDAREIEDVVDEIEKMAPASRSLASTGTSRSTPAATRKRIFSENALSAIEYLFLRRGQCQPTIKFSYTLLFSEN